MSLLLTKTSKNILSVLFFCFLVIFLLWITGPRIKPEPIKPHAWRIYTRQITPMTHEPNLELNGTVESLNHTTMRSGIRDDVIAVHAREGEYVEAGEVLVELDPRNAKSLLDQAKADLQIQQAQYESRLKKNDSEKKQLALESELLVIAKKQVQRQQSLRSANMASPAALDQTLREARQRELSVTQIALQVQLHDQQLAIDKGAYNKAKAALERAEIDFDRSKIKAPFAGYVTDVFVSPGDHLSVGANVIRLYDVNALQVRAQIPGRYTQAIRHALFDKLNLEARVINPPTDRIQLQLVRIGADIKSNQGGNDIFLHLVEGKPLLAPGENIQFLLTLPKVTKALRIPSTALYDDDHIYLVQNNKLKQVPVTIAGTVQDEQGEIFYIVKNTKITKPVEVMITHLPNAHTGQLVTVVNNHE